MRPARRGLTRQAKVSSTPVASETDSDSPPAPVEPSHFLLRRAAPSFHPPPPRALRPLQEGRHGSLQRGRPRRCLRQRGALQLLWRATWGWAFQGEARGWSRFGVRPPSRLCSPCSASERSVEGTRAARGGCSGLGSLRPSFSLLHRPSGHAFSLAGFATRTPSSAEHE